MKRKTLKVELTLDERKALLAKSAYDCRDVMKMTGYAKSKAFAVMKKCKKELNGRIFLNDHVITRSSLLAFMGTSIEQEVEIIRQLEKKQT